MPENIMREIIDALQPLGVIITNHTWSWCLDGKELPTIALEGFIDIERTNSQTQNTYTPKSILRSGNRTIVFWKDGTKTIVKRGADEPDSDYAAFTAALAIKIFGSNSAVKRIVAGTKEQEPKKKRKTEVKE